MVALGKHMMKMADMAATVAASDLTAAQIRLRIATFKLMAGLTMATLAFVVLEKLGVPTREALFLIAGGFFAVKAVLTGGKMWTILGLIGTAISYIATAITMRRSPPLYLLLPIVAVGLRMLGSAAAAVAGPMAAAAVPMMLFGIGLSLILAPISLLVAAMGYFVGKMAELFGVIVTVSPSTLFGLAAGFGALGIAIGLVSLAFMMPGTLYGFGRVTKALGEMGEALNTFSTEKLSIFSELIDKLKGLKEIGDVKVSLSAAAEGISDLSLIHI